MTRGERIAIRIDQTLTIVPEYAKHVSKGIDPTFYDRAMEARNQGGGIIVGGENYGQGSAREHAALCPMYLGIKAVLGKSFARIHLANLINFDILPLTFTQVDHYEHIARRDMIRLDLTGLATKTFILRNETQQLDIPVTHPLGRRRMRYYTRRRKISVRRA